MYSDKIGGISWVDLSVDNASSIRDFYQTVVGFKSESIPVADHQDYVMMSPTNPDDQVGICHAQGDNANLPPQWLVYFNVSDIDESIKQCLALGGKIIKNKSDMGDYYMCVINDPAGAVVALIAVKS